jgi:hypothetical protein
LGTLGHGLGLNYVYHICQFVKNIIFTSLEASEKRPLFERETYTVGWICALELELTAAMAMLGKHLASLPKDVKDENSYTIHRIRDHNVVLALLPRTGKANAVMVAANLHKSFPVVRFILMVGIEGGVPSPTTNDIQLSDVVVCKLDLVPLCRSYYQSPQYDTSGLLIKNMRFKNEYQRSKPLDRPVVGTGA